MSPVRLQERITSLDVLRGISLIGIFIVNMISFHSPMFYYNPYEWWEKADATWYMMIDIFVQASFYPIFAMMFGYGLMIMWQRAQQRGVSFQKIGIRRMLALLVIGIIHAFFIWSGDILILYALIGFLLLLMLKWSGKTLMIVGLSIFLLPQLLLSALMVLLSLLDPKMAAFWKDFESIQHSIARYSNGTFWEVMQQRWADWTTANSPETAIFILLMILPMMMIGAGASKLRWLQTAQENKNKWLIILFISLPLGIFIKALPYMIKPNISYTFIQDMVGGPILGFAYVAIIVLLMNIPVMVKVMRPFAKAGRMSLTVYITQSIIATLIFYSYGLGLYGQVTLRQGTLLAIGIYVLQLIFAELWFTKYKYGPLEKLLRLMTYGKTAVVQSSKNNK